MPSFNKSFIMNHTCLRIKDPKVSVPFYENIFGMKLIRTLNFNGFSLYMLSYETLENKTQNWSARVGVLELCHNHGVENDDAYTINNGNGSEHRGFGHICVSVDNIVKTEQKLLANNVKFQKKLADGRQKNIAFALDPDGYWIELIENGISKAEDATSPSTYKFNHSMIRVKDPEKSLAFYREKLGMKLLSTSAHEGAKFTLYFLGYVHDDKFVENTMSWEDKAKLEGIVELTHNWGTENDAEFTYHNGNSTDNGAKQGYGHICVTCDDGGKFCKELETEFGDKIDWAVQWGKANLSPELAFIRDPDGYSIEILSNNFDTPKL